MAERVGNYDLIRLYSLSAPKRLLQTFQNTHTPTYNK